MDILIRIGQLLLSLTILVFIHELGHFTMARLFKIRVNKFYLFFDPWFALFRYKPKNSDTEYGIGWLPLGGYCAIDGMVDETLSDIGEASDAKPWEFRSKPVWQRLLVMAGGVIFNFVLAMLIYGAVAYTWGTTHIPMQNIGDNLSYTSVGHAMGLVDGDRPYAVDGKVLEEYDPMMIQTIADGKTLTVVRPHIGNVDIAVPVDMVEATLATDSAFMYLNVPAVVGEVLPGSNAERDGFREGDRILALDGKERRGLATLLPAIQASRGDSVLVTVQTAGGQVVTRYTVADKEKGLGIVFRQPGEVFGMETRTYGIFESFPAGIREAVKQLKSYVGQLKYIATKEGASKLGGLGTIGSLFAPMWDWHSFWIMSAFLSVILAVMNLLPIPGLDGGHILFLLVEWVMGRPLPIKWQTRIQIAGMLFLLALMLYANIMDVFRFLF
ncbi:MAG: RIP metalloprotease RseP [Porphyromonas sp.]|nr:RIP metalloprotease RseP [Bacteroidales bacterium]MDY3101259.1 RIP metalloprotease RseP [Porphyromonas sp.]